MIFFAPFEKIKIYNDEVSVIKNYSWGKVTLFPVIIHTELGNLHLKRFCPVLFMRGGEFDNYKPTDSIEFMHYLFDKYILKYDFAIEGQKIENINYISFSERAIIIYFDWQYIILGNQRFKAHALYYYKENQEIHIRGMAGTSIDIIKIDDKRKKYIFIDGSYIDEYWED